MVFIVFFMNTDEHQPRTALSHHQTQNPAAARPLRPPLTKAESEGDGDGGRTWLRLDRRWSRHVDDDDELCQARGRVGTPTVSGGGSHARVEKLKSLLGCDLDRWIRYNPTVEN
ncbi:hypothetical protein GQ457_10G013240 [Hibiscus cannabinus]